MEENTEFLEMNDEDFAKENPPEPEEGSVNEAASSASGTSYDANSDSGSSDHESGSGSDDFDNRLHDALDTEEETGSETQANVDYQGFYNKVMAPFKANGKTIQLNSPEEAIQLMQQGANYTRKMQSLAPYRKMLIMLENNGLLDESKINYLIDLDKRNPEAIKKLVKDSGMDPIDIDLESVNYQAGNYQVSDAEANFTEALNNLKDSTGGTETLQEINSQWDSQSKDILWQDPDLLRVINEQRQSGVYQMIVNEIDRQRTLGNIPPNAPFLEAYKRVGDYLVGQQQTQNTRRQAVATRVGNMPRSNVVNSARVKAAAPTRTNTRRSERFINPLELSDEDFLKLKV
jgi:hypothetical protein